MLTEKKKNMEILAISSNYYQSEAIFLKYMFFATLITSAEVFRLIICKTH